MSLSSEYARGKLLAAMNGTSQAAPYIAHWATKLLGQYPDFTMNTIRALLVGNASWPDASFDLLQNRESLLRICGYGNLQTDNILYSTEQDVCIIAEEHIKNDEHHFYEIPVPEDLFVPGKRSRKLSITLAYCPIVLNTRFDYKSTRIEFKVVTANSLEEAQNRFHNEHKDDFDALSEMTGSHISWTQRSKGTAQSGLWEFKRIPKKLKNTKLVVVVTRNDFSWAMPYVKEFEGYSLVVSWKDRENTEAHLYTQIQHQLQVKARARECARIS